MVKKILIGLGVIVAIALIAAALLPKNMDYEKSIQINVSKAFVWPHINSMKGIDSWSPWNDYEPDMKKEWSGNSGEIGESMAWDGKEEKVGAGKQTISKIDAPNRIETDILFLRPFESKSTAYVSLEENDEGTKATWGFHSEMPWPMNLMMLTMDMEAQMGKDWDNGLNKLKELSEASAKADADRIALEEEEAAAAAATVEDEEVE